MAERTTYPDGEPCWAAGAVFTVIDEAHRVGNQAP